MLGSTTSGLQYSTKTIAGKVDIWRRMLVTMSTAMTKQDGVCLGREFVASASFSVMSEAIEIPHRQVEFNGQERVNPL